MTEDEFFEQYDVIALDGWVDFTQIMGAEVSDLQKLDFMFYAYAKAQLDARKRELENEEMRNALETAERIGAEALIETNALKGRLLKHELIDNAEIAEMQKVIDTLKDTVRVQKNALGTADDLIRMLQEDKAALKAHLTDGHAQGEGLPLGVKTQGKVTTPA